MDKQVWLDQVVEETLEPDLAICDPHHHLWDLPSSRYLLDELLADIGSGHNVVSTVFMEFVSMYRLSGPEAMRPVGETEFVNGIAAMSASGVRTRRSIPGYVLRFARRASMAVLLLVGTIVDVEA